MSNINEVFGKRLRRLRKDSILTQDELAEAADISVSFLGGIERGHKSPTLETLDKLATALGISLSELVMLDCESINSDEGKKNVFR